MLGAYARARPLLSEGGLLVFLTGSARGRVPYGPPSPTVRATGMSRGASAARPTRPLAAAARP